MYNILSILPVAMRNLVFLAVLALAVFIRFWQLGQIPNGLSVDEADLAYNAYAILKTGKDVYGQNLPLFFQSLDDYKPGLVFYSSIPATAIFGLSDFSIRLAPAIFGILSIFLVYLVVRQLYPQNQILPYISAVLISFAPWHIALSRAMIWYNQLIFFYLFSLVLLFLSFKKNQWLIIPAAFVLGLTVYIYYAAIIYLPAVLAIITLLNWQIIRKLKFTPVALLVLLITTIPALIHYSSGDAKTRLNAISVLTPDITLPTSIAQIEQDKLVNMPFPQVLHNRRLVYLSGMLDNYFDYFNLDYLFITAKNIRYFYVNNVGLFYLIELPFFLYGLYTLIGRREKSDLLLLSLLVIGPVPAALTLGSPFPHRALLTILSIQIISAIGLAAVLGKSSGFNFLKLGLITLYAASVYFFLHQYFVHSPKEFTSEFDNGAWYSTVKDAVTKVNQHKDKYEKVVFTWSSPKLVPPVYFHLYNKVDPRILQAKAANWANESPSYKQIYNQIDNIEFRSINWEQDKNLKNTLFIGYPSEFPQDIEVIDKTYLPNGKPHFVFVETQ